MKYDLAKIRSNSDAIWSYVAAQSQAYEPFAKRKVEYKLDQTVVKEVKKYARSVVVVVFSAEWCPDCYLNVPILDMISEATNLEIHVFGHLMRDSKSNIKKWAVPPSPKEVNEFNVIKIPYIVVLDQSGEKIGEIVENPPPNMTLEKALLSIIKK